VLVQNLNFKFNANKCLNKINEEMKYKCKVVEIVFKYCIGIIFLVKCQYKLD